MCCCHVSLLEDGSSGARGTSALPTMMHWGWKSNGNKYCVQERKSHWVCVKSVFLIPGFVSYKAVALWRTDLFRRALSEVISVFLNLSKTSAPEDNGCIANPVRIAELLCLTEVSPLVAFWSISYYKIFCLTNRWNKKLYWNKVMRKTVIASWGEIKLCLEEKYILCTNIWQLSWTYLAHLEMNCL